MVVMTILLVLTTIAVIFVPNLMQRQRASEGGSQLQQWLLIAKQRALRDQAPRGIRLNLTSGSSNVTDLQYIEQPPDFSGGNVKSIDTTSNTVTFDFGGGTDFSGGFTDTSQWLVQRGDYLEIKGGGSVCLITGVTKTQLILNSTPTAVQTPTWQYRVIRQPRVLVGEDSLQMPQDVAIDLSLSRGGNQSLYNAASPPAYIDILFSPSGTVIGQGAAYDKFILWVRDVALGSSSGDQTLVTVYTRTGLIAAHPVNIDDPNNPYSYTQDGLPSGQ
jgi:hypothetical protein